MQKLGLSNAASTTILVVIASLGLLVSCGGDDDMPTEPDPNGINGYVTDAKSAKPIVGANITTTPSTESATTNANGKYEITDIIARDYTVTATKPGYLTDSRSIVVELNGIKEVNIPLSAEQNDPVLSVDPTFLDFQEDDDLRQFAIRNAGTGEISFSVVATGYDWIEFAEGGGGFQSQITGTVTNNTRTITVQVNRDNLPGDVHTPEITVDGGAAGRAIVDCRVVKRRTDGPLLGIFPDKLDIGDQITKDLDIINYGVGSLHWSISEDIAWLSFDRYTDFTAKRTTVRATVDRSGLDPDTYSGQIHITSEDDAGERFVDVEMTVSSDATIIVPETNLGFGEEATELELEILKSGNGSVSWLATATQPWISLDPASDSAPATLTVGVERGTLAEGDYDGAIEISDDSSGSWQVRAEVSVEMLVRIDSTPPAKITDLTATPSSTSTVRLHWTAVGDDGTSGVADSYQLQFSDDGGLTWRELSISTSPSAPGSTESHTVDGLSSNAYYCFRVRALDEIPENANLVSYSESGCARPYPTASISVPDSDWRLTRVIDAGSSRPANERINSPRAAHYDPGTQSLYFASGGGFNKIYRIGELDAVQTYEIAHDPDGFAFDEDWIYYSHSDGKKVFKIARGSTVGTEIADFGTGTAFGIAVGSSRYSGTVVGPNEGLAATRGTHSISRWNKSGGAPQILVSGGDLENPVDVEIGTDAVYAVDPEGDGRILQVFSSSVDVIEELVPIVDPRGITTDPLTGRLLVMDTNPSAPRAYWIDPDTGSASILAEGFGSADCPACIDMIQDGSRIFITDLDRRKIYEITRVSMLGKKLPTWGDLD